MIKHTMWHGSRMAAASVLAVLSCNTSTPSDLPIGTAQEALSSAAFSASADTSVRAGTPNQNSGTQTDLDINRTLVQFSAPALSSTVGPQDHDRHGRRSGDTGRLHADARWLAVHSGGRRVRKT